MWIEVASFICSLELLSSLHLIDVPDTVGLQPRRAQQESDHEDAYRNTVKYKSPVQFESDDTSAELDSEMENNRRYWLNPQKTQGKRILKTGYDEEKDENLKSKISTLVEQTLHDTERRVKSIETLKEKHREQASYRVGFILSMVKKSRDVLNELFNVAVKHRDDWKALEQMKIFELIVHTNVDTTNLVRQLVETHIQHLNSSSDNGGTLRLSQERKRVVLL